MANTFAFQIEDRERDMLRFLCNEYTASAAHVLRQLIRERYFEFDKSGNGPKHAPKQRLDHPRTNAAIVPGQCRARPATVSPSTDSPTVSADISDGLADS